MALSKVNFNSMNVTPAASKAIKFNSSNNGLETGDIGGSLVLISTQTASSSSTISFTSGIDSTYKEYQVHFTDVHPSSTSDLRFNLSIDGGSNYNVTKTTTLFTTFHDEGDSYAEVGYRTGKDEAQTTNDQKITDDINTDNNASGCGILHLFNPSSTTFVKHFLSNTQSYHIPNANKFSMNTYCSGYANTTSAVNAITFKFGSGNIDSGTFKLYGVS